MRLPHRGRSCRHDGHRFAADDDIIYNRSSALADSRGRRAAPR